MYCASLVALRYLRALVYVMPHMAPIVTLVFRRCIYRPTLTYLYTILSTRVLDKIFDRVIER